MRARPCAEARALSVRPLLAALAFAQLALGCSPFEAPLTAVDAAFEPSGSGQDAEIEAPVDAAVAESEPDAELDADLDAELALADAFVQDASADAQTDAAVVDAAVVIPRRPTLAKCGFAAPITTGKQDDPSLGELSGIAVSRRNARVIWTIEDSGGGAQVHALNDEGKLVASFTLTGTAEDYEDIAVGPGPMPGVSYLYIADIGDNHGDRPNVAVYRAPEPEVVWNQAWVSATLPMVEPFPIKYPDGAHNAEALIVDPQTQDMYIITKDGFTRPNTLYRLASPQQPATMRTLVPVGAVYGGNGTDLAVTAADMSADGKHIIVRTLHSATHWTHRDGVSVGDTILKDTACDAELAVEDKGESISFATNGYYSLSEGVGQPLHFVAFTSLK